jgi:hypothetical protein
MKMRGMKMTDPVNESVLSGFNTLLMGPPGSGKTTAIGTLADAGVEIFYLGLEPGLESLLGYWTDRGKPIPDNVHWHMLESPKASWDEMLDQVTKINTMALDSLAKAVDPHRSKYDQFRKLLGVMNDFPDDRTGKRYGSVDTWTPARALVVDGMAGLGRAAMSTVIGGKAVRSQSDWGIAQGILEKFVRKCCDDLRCHFVLIAHVERETDQVLGGVKLMVSTLGRALAPTLPSMFSDVILTVREGTKWTWDTGTATADVKVRNLPYQTGLPADFGPVVRKWISRGGKL